MYVHVVDILAQLSDAAHLPFVLFSVFFIVLFFFCFRLFLLFCMCLIVLFNFYLFIYLFNFYLFQSGSKISAQYRKKRINGIFPEELQLLQLTETKKTREDWHYLCNQLKDAHVISCKLMRLFQKVFRWLFEKFHFIADITF